jgi:Rod binding domain-containing protein
MNPDLFAAQSFSSSAYLDATLAARPGVDFANGASGKDPAQAAQEFESFFLSQVLDTLQSGPSLESAFGGGAGEQAWKSFLNEAYADAIARAGGIGLADRLKAEIIALQAAQSQSAESI